MPDKPRTLLALDCATKTGWALWRDGRIVESGVQDFSLKRGESPGMRFLYFRQWLEKLMGAADPDVIVYEQAHYRGGAATQVCVGLTTRVLELAAAFDSDVVGCHTATLKKHATGNGRASKAHMMARAAEILGREPLDDNEADAVCMAVWLAEIIGAEGAADE